MENINTPIETPNTNNQKDIDFRNQLIDNTQRKELDNLLKEYRSSVDVETLLDGDLENESACLALKLVHDYENEDRIYDVNSLKLMKCIVELRKQNIKSLHIGACYVYAFEMENDSASYSGEKTKFPFSSVLRILRVLKPGMSYDDFKARAEKELQVMIDNSSNKNDQQEPQNEAKKLTLRERSEQLAKEYGLSAYGVDYGASIDQDKVDAIASTTPTTNITLQKADLNNIMRILSRANALIPDEQKEGLDVARAYSVVSQAHEEAQKELINRTKSFCKETPEYYRHTYVPQKDNGMTTPEEIKKLYEANGFGHVLHPPKETKSASTNSKSNSYWEQRKIREARGEILSGKELKRDKAL